MVTLSTRSRYGTRLLMSLARSSTQGPVQIAEIAKDQGISVKYLEQIALTLKKAGIIETVRGRGGGHRLAKSPQEITLDEIIGVLEGGRQFVRCVSQPELCSRAPRCAPRLVWQELSQTLYEKLSRWTLEDLLRLEDMLAGQSHRGPREDETTLCCPALAPTFFS